MGGREGGREKFGGDWGFLVENFSALLQMTILKAYLPCNGNRGCKPKYDQLTEPECNIDGDFMITMCVHGNLDRNGNALSPSSETRCGR